jgi:N-acetylmuramoyl-L-alanine amidase
MKKYAFLLLLSFFAGCGSGEKFSEYFEVPVELKTPASEQKYYDNVAPVMRGIKVFIDPGHGGEDRRTKGRLGLVTEADLNLNVALALKDYLTKAGAIVTISREKDVTVDLKYRSVLANNSGCDFFISIHHNAPGSKEDSWTNYTSTYYHATENDYEYDPCGHDMARYVQRDLTFATGNSGGLGSFDGTYSDYLIYPNEGFSVLRRTTAMPAILVECSFVTGRFEELRLANKDYNKVQAWGIFKGLCRYFKNGIPKIKEISGDTISYKSEGALYQLSDKKGIDIKSIDVKIDSVSAKYIYDLAANRLCVNLDDITPGEHEIKIVVANKNGNHSFPFRKKLFIK